jgi:SnoaL-like protein
MPLHNDPRALAVAYIEAVGNKEFDRVAELLHPDADFITSGPRIQGIPAYVGALRRLAPILVRNDVHTTVVDGNDVAIVYDFVTDTPAGSVPTVEWLTTEGGRIRTSRLIFHKEHWPAAVAELARRSSMAAAASQAAATGILT